MPAAGARTGQRGNGTVDAAPASVGVEPVHPRVPAEPGLLPAGEPPGRPHGLVPRLLLGRTRRRGAAAPGRSRARGAPSGPSRSPARRSARTSSTRPAAHMRSTRCCDALVQHGAGHGPARAARPVDGVASAAAAWRSERPPGELDAPPARARSAARCRAGSRAAAAGSRGAAARAGRPARLGQLAPPAGPAPPGRCRGTRRSSSAART